jgi:hypothetical protein
VVAPRGAALGWGKGTDGEGGMRSAGHGCGWAASSWRYAHASQGLLRETKSAPQGTDEDRVGGSGEASLALKQAHIPVFVDNTSALCH